jgi:hypothetical protein
MKSATTHHIWNLEVWIGIVMKIPGKSGKLYEEPYGSGIEAIFLAEHVVLMRVAQLLFLNRGCQKKRTETTLKVISQ